MSTIYKTTNSIYIGNTKGFARDHTDYYVPNGRPKKLWLKELVAAVVPKAYAAALTSWLHANEGRLPRSLALDGKSIGYGRCRMIIILCRREDSHPMAIIPTEGKKEDSEVSQARVLPHELPTLGLQCVLQALTGSAKDKRPINSLCQAGCCMTSCHHKCRNETPREAYRDKVGEGLFADRNRDF